MTVEAGADVMIKPSGFGLNPEGPKENIAHHKSHKEALTVEANALKAKDNNHQTDELRSTIRAANGSRRADFTKDTLLFFQHVGIDPFKVDPIPIGLGANHAVYRYETPEAAQRVIKLTRPGGPLSKMNKGISEKENIELIREYFGDYFPKTEFIEDPLTMINCQIQDVVEGVPITDKNYTFEIQKQLERMALMNKRAVTEKQISLDFVGMHGFIKWMAKQLNKLIFKKGTAEIANVLVDRHGQVKLIDTDFYRFNDPRQSSREHLFAKIAYFFTQRFMKHYFKVNV